MNYDVKHARRASPIPDSHHDFARRLLHFMPTLKNNPPRGLWGSLHLIVFAGVFAALALYLRIGSFSSYLSFEPWLSPDISLDTTFTRNVSSCPGSVYIFCPYRFVRTDFVGYDLTSVKTSEYGLVANLVLAGEECHAYGTDHKNIIVEVTYETKTQYSNKAPMPALADPVFERL